MLAIQDLLRLQTEHDVKAGAFKEHLVPFEDYIVSCRKYITANMPKEYTDGTWDDLKKDQELDNLIANFVHKHEVKVSGYVTLDGELNVALLLEHVIDNVKGYGILKEALDDPDVDEIQINDYKTIYVVRKGVTMPYQTRDGKFPQFTNNAEITIFLNKLINDGSVPQFTDGAPLLNAKTAAKQYRVNAVHPIANARGRAPYDFPITTVVIRKFKETKLNFDDMVRGGSVTPKMARLLGLIGRIDLNTFFIGPTASGKTTLLTAVAQNIPIYKRLCLVQNPTEITFFERDGEGKNKRNVLHWEANDAANAEKKNTNTMSNLISNALRVTPDVLILGEARAPDEFTQLQRAMQTGHRVIGTYHAKDSADAIERGASELSTGMGIALEEAKHQWARSVDIIIAQHKFPDGTRKVMEITEVEGFDEKGELKLRPLFVYKLLNAYTDEDGVEHVRGKFEMVNPISEKFQVSLRKDCVADSAFAEFTQVGDAID